jgi:hypothetical protein
VITPITACFRLARRYRDAMKNSNFISTADNTIVASASLGWPVLSVWVFGMTPKKQRPDFRPASAKFRKT